jgi:phage baseplate assembly protein W
MTQQLSGLAFPFGVKDGRVRRSDGFEKVQDDVRHLLSTRLGERTMLRGYGGGVHPHVGQVNDATLAALVRHEITIALRSFMPDVQLVGSIRTAIDGAQLVVSLDYAADPRAIVRRIDVALPLGEWNP